jgi:hypothetical protein
MYYAWGMGHGSWSKRYDALYKYRIEGEILDPKRERKDK